MDKEMIHSKLDLIQENMKLIEELSQIKPENLKNNRRDLQAAKHSLQEAIEASIDIASHIISTEGYRKPKNYRDTFQVLEEENVINQELSDRLKDLAGFRKIIVHEYGKIDVKRLHEILNVESKALKEYSKRTLELLENK